jgi:hypothetical protein
VIAIQANYLRIKGELSIKKFLSSDNHLYPRAKPHSHPAFTSVTLPKGNGGQRFHHMSWQVRLLILGVFVAAAVGLAYVFTSRTSTSAAGKSPAASTNDPAAPSTSVSNERAPADASTADSSVPSANAVLPALVMKKFSDQELQTLASLPPQQQAEQMMMAGVNHYDGATSMVMERVQSWRGQLKKTPNWDTVELAARYSSDLRVRDAAIEVDLAMFQLEKSPATAQRLLDDAQANVGNRGFDLTMLGMLANRGVEASRIHDALRDWAHNPDEGTRFWAIEGLAYIGTDDTINDFLDVLRNDPSLNVRQRCGASLAKAGMLTREKRMAAVPGLLEIAADSSQNDVVRGWAFRALHEITAEPIGNDAAAWRAWFDAHGSERVEQFRRGDPNAVLGNS